MQWDEIPETGRTWRVRARLADRPGTLATLATHLGKHGCNLLSVAVLPVAGDANAPEETATVVDELVLHAPATLTEEELTRLVEAHGGRCVGISSASVRDLVDAQTTVLRAASDALSGASTAYEALRRVLGADWVRPLADDGDLDLPAATAADVVGSIQLEPGGHRATITLDTGDRVVAAREWAPFTDGELSRVQALARLLVTVGRPSDLPVRVSAAFGASVVVRIAREADTAALADMHGRCSRATLFARYHSGIRRLPDGWAQRLLQPPRGHTLVAVAGSDVIGFAQLIPSLDDPRSAELSLLVEDCWQRQGVGAALLTAVHGRARGLGIGELIGLCLPDEVGAARTAARLGLVTSTRVESGMTRLAITVGASSLPQVRESEPPATREAKLPPRRTAEPVHRSSPADPLVRQLTSLDAQFLNAETSTTLTHVGVMAILDPSTAPGGSLTVDDLRALIGSRLHLIDPLRWKLRQVPLGLDLPYWVDSTSPDLEHHIREIGLPAPGTDQQLAEQVARLSETPLSREHPLWECYLVHGLSGGRQALYMKVHHAVVDGVSGAEVLAVMLDLSPEPSEVPAPTVAASSEPAPGIATLLGKSAWHLATRPAQLLMAAPTMLPHLLELPGAVTMPGAGALGAVASRVGRLTGLASEKNLPPRAPTPPHTPFNDPVTGHRSYAFTSLPLAEIKTIKKGMGLTVNDVVMALCTTALRRWLIDHDALPDAPLVAAMPVSVRTQEQMGTGGNQISFMLSAIPTNEHDPEQRVRLLNASLAAAKERFRGIPSTLLHEWSAALPQLFHGMASRAFLRAATLGAPPFNLFISNVPGPQLPLYAAGATVTGTFPSSVVSDLGGGINITVMSYNGHVDFGILACREVVPDVWDLVDHLHEALAELTGLSDPAAPSVTAPAAACGGVRSSAEPAPSFVDA